MGQGQAPLQGPLRGPGHQPDLAALDNDPDHAAVGQRTEQQRLRERLLDDTLYQASHGTGAERAVVLEYLDPVEEILETGTTFADRVLRRWDGEFGRDPARYVAAYRV